MLPVPDPMIPDYPMIPNRPITLRQRYMLMMEILLLDHSLACLLMPTPTPTCPVSTLMPTTTPVPSSVPNLLAPIPPFPNA